MLERAKEEKKENEDEEMEIFESSAEVYDLVYTKSLELPSIAVEDAKISKRIRATVYKSKDNTITGIRLEHMIHRGSYWSLETETFLSTKEVLLLRRIFEKTLQSQKEAKR